MIYIDIVFIILTLNIFVFQMWHLYKFVMKVIYFLNTKYEYLGPIYKMFSGINNVS